MKRTIALLLSLVLVPLFAPAAVAAKRVGTQPSPVERELRRVETELKAHRLLRELAPTSAQKAAILAIVRAHVDEKAQVEKQEAATQSAVFGAMTTLRNEVLANQGVSEETKKAARGAEKPVKLAKDPLKEKTFDRVSQIFALLTTTQGAVLRRGDPKANAASKLAEAKSAFVAQLTAAREKGDQAMVDALSKAFDKFGLRGDEITAALPHAKAVLATTEPKAGPATLPLVEKILALPAKGILSAKVDEEAEKQIEKVLLTPEALGVLDSKARDTFVDHDFPADHAATVADIRVMNLVNALFLTRPQTTKLVALIGDAGKAWDGQSDRERAMAETILPLAKKAQAAYRTGVEPDAATAQALADLGKERKLLKEARKEMEAKHEAKLRAILTENQVDLVANFVPCTVPVQSLTNPERVGQANNNGKVEKALERIRKVDDARLPEGLRALQAEVAEALRTHKHAEEAAATAALVPGIVMVARSMDDAEFKMKKRDLAKHLAVPAKAKVVGEKLGERLVEYLLSPNLRPILANRLKARRS